ncbi:hypothetical protein AAG570_004188 [Ranatra chinensis]|uniref:Uncharacterized protein n=1 Tax=Ranatra chinensis TaxID=642074 RepID=A0ABD0YRP2_9HEMI
MASKRRNMFHKNKTQETTEEEGEGGADQQAEEAEQEIKEESGATKCTKNENGGDIKKSKKKSFSFDPCPHRAIKWELVDRTTMNQKEYDAYLAKPKWLGKAWYREVKEEKKKPVRRMTYIYKDLEPIESYHPVELPKIEKLPKVEMTNDFINMLKLLVLLSMLIGKKTNTDWWKTIKWNGKKDISQNNPEVELQVTQLENSSTLPEPTQDEVPEPDTSANEQNPQ